MSRTQPICPPWFWTVTATVALTSILATPRITQAVPDAHSSLSSQHRGFIAPLPEVFGGRDFEDTGRPLHRSAGGSRDPSDFFCWDTLMAVVPLRHSYTPLPTQTQPEDCEAQPVSEATLTTLAKPTLWFYIPDYAVQPNSNLELKLFNASETLIHTQSLELSVDNGFISVPFTYALAEGQTYRWTFSIVLNPNRPTLNPEVTGTLQRIAAPDALVKRLLTAPAEEQGLLYAEYGIWQDALTLVGDERRTQPADATLLTTWNVLLNTAGWGAIAADPITPCCTTPHLVQRSSFDGFHR